MVGGAAGAASWASAAGATSESKTANHSLMNILPAVFFIGTNAAQYSGKRIQRCSKKRAIVLFKDDSSSQSDRLPQPYQGTPMRKLLALTAGVLALVAVTV